MGSKWSMISSVLLIRLPLSIDCRGINERRMLTVLCTTDGGVVLSILPLSLAFAVVGLCSRIPYVRWQLELTVNRQSSLALPYL